MVLAGSWTGVPNSVRVKREIRRTIDELRVSRVNSGESLKQLKAPVRPFHERAGLRLADSGFKQKVYMTSSIPGHILNSAVGSGRSGMGTGGDDRSPLEGGPVAGGAPAREPSRLSRYLDTLVEEGYKNTLRDQNGILEEELGKRDMLLELYAEEDGGVGDALTEAAAILDGIAKEEHLHDAKLTQSDEAAGMLFMLKEELKNAKHEIKRQESMYGAERRANKHLCRMLETTVQRGREAEDIIVEKETQLQDIQAQQPDAETLVDIIERVRDHDEEVSQIRSEKEAIEARLQEAVLRLRRKKEKLKEARRREVVKQQEIDTLQEQARILASTAVPGGSAGDTGDSLPRESSPHSEQRESRARRSSKRASSLWAKTASLAKVRGLSPGNKRESSPEGNWEGIFQEMEERLRSRSDPSGWDAIREHMTRKRKQRETWGDLVKQLAKLRAEDNAAEKKMESKERPSTSDDDHAGPSPKPVVPALQAKEATIEDAPKPSKNRLGRVARLLANDDLWTQNYNGGGLAGKDAGTAPHRGPPDDAESVEGSLFHASKKPRKRVKAKDDKKLGVQGDAFDFNSESWGRWAEPNPDTIPSQSRDVVLNKPPPMSEYAKPQLQGTSSAHTTNAGAKSRLAVLKHKIRFVSGRPSKGAENQATIAPSHPMERYFAHHYEHREENEKRLARMKAGSVMLKYSFSQKKCAQRLIQVTSNEKKVTWRNPQTKMTKSGVPVASIVRILFGPRTRAFRRATVFTGVPVPRPWNCFSIITGDRTVDVCAPDNQTTITWYLGLQHLLCKHGRDGNLPSNITTRGMLLWRMCAMRVQARAGTLNMTTEAFLAIGLRTAGAQRGSADDNISENRGTVKVPRPNQELDVMQLASRSDIDLSSFVPIELQLLGSRIKNTCLRNEGIMRRAPLSKDYSEARTAFHNNPTKFDWKYYADGYGVLAGQFFKDYLKVLPEALIPPQVEERILQADDGDLTVSGISAMIKSLSEEKRVTLEYVCHVLVHVLAEGKHNGATPSNLVDALINQRGIFDYVASPNKDKVQHIYLGRRMMLETMVTQFNVFVMHGAFVGKFSDISRKRSANMKSNQISDGPSCTPLEYVAPKRLPDPRNGRIPKGKGVSHNEPGPDSESRHRKSSSWSSKIKLFMNKGVESKGQSGSERYAGSSGDDQPDEYADNLAEPVKLSTPVQEPDSPVKMVESRGSYGDKLEAIRQSLQADVAMREEQIRLSVSANLSQDPSNRNSVRSINVEGVLPDTPERPKARVKEQARMSYTEMAAERLKNERKQDPPPNGDNDKEKSMNARTRLITANQEQRGSVVDNGASGVSDLVANVGRARSSSASKMATSLRDLQGQVRKLNEEIEVQNSTEGDGVELSVKDSATGSVLMSTRGVPFVHPELRRKISMACNMHDKDVLELVEKFLAVSMRPRKLTRPQFHIIAEDDLCIRDPKGLSALFRAFDINGDMKINIVEFVSGVCMLVPGQIHSKIDALWSALADPQTNQMAMETFETFWNEHLPRGVKICTNLARSDLMDRVLGDENRTTELETLIRNLNKHSEGCTGAYHKSLMHVELRSILVSVPADHLSESEWKTFCARSRHVQEWLSFFVS